MDPAVLEVFVPISVVLGGCGLLALKIWTGHQLKMRETSDGDERLAEAVQHLTDELGLVRADLAELQERADFTERMLSEVRSRNAIEPGDSV